MSLTILIVDKSAELKTLNVKIYLEEELYKKSLKMLEDFTKFYEEGFLNRAYNALWNYIDSINVYVHSNEPWKLLSENKIEDFKI